ncbi:MAG: SurA N-terminal domain-containing protein [Deltaproteobacteria bacterium]|nr:SurA N-terminal domain-containing protein [Deltaproteobacteria bacterium]
MLAFIREKKRSKFVILILGVIILVFVFWGMSPQGGAINNASVATVDGTPIPLETYSRIYQERAKQIPKEFLENMNLRQDVADMLINRVLIANAARKDGVKVSKGEVQDGILADPTFHNDGKFDFDFYISLLNRNRIKEEDYEASIKEEILIQKMTNKMASTITVIETEARKLFEREGREVSLNYAELKSKSFEASVKPTDEDLEKYYEENKSTFMRPTEIKALYVYLDKKELAKSVSVLEEEIQARYEKNISRYTKPVEFKASHILIKPSASDGASPEELVKAKDAAREKAAGLLKELKGGANFEALAKKHSEDKGSGANGGDLGYFGLGRMVKPFETAVVNLNIGETSELVETRFGFHIIRLDDKLDDRTTPLKEVREDIEDVLKRNEADEEARARMASLFAVLESTDVDSIEALRAQAKSSGAVVKLTELFAEDDTEVELASNQRLSDEAFVLNAGAIANSIVDSRGKLYIIKVLERVDAHVPAFDKVKGLIKEVFIEARSRELADAAGKEIIKELKEGKSFKGIVKKRSLKSGKTEFFKSGDGSIPKLNVYVSEGSEIFTLTTEAPVYEETVPYADGVYVFVLRSSKEADNAGFTAVRDKLKGRIFNEKKQELIGDWIEGLREVADITYNEDYM